MTNLVPREMVEEWLAELGTMKQPDVSLTLIYRRDDQTFEHTWPKFPSASGGAFSMDTIYKGYRFAVTITPTAEAFERAERNLWIDSPDDSADL